MAAENLLADSILPKLLAAGIGGLPQQALLSLGILHSELFCGKSREGFPVFKCEGDLHPFEPPLLNESQGSVDGFKVSGAAGIPDPMIGRPEVETVTLSAQNCFHMPF